MISEEDIARIWRTLDFVAMQQRSHDDQIGKLVEQSDQHSKKMDVLTDRTIQAMDAINQLARIAASHEIRIDTLENPSE
jgi:hypothetical protein